MRVCFEDGLIRSSVKVRLVCKRGVGVADKVPNQSWIHTVIAAMVVAACASAASAQISQDQALVVYDSRIPDSKAVAEYYAGSKKVPGGVGNLPGVRPLVWTVDLSTLGVPETSAGSISYDDFVSRLRTPIRSYLTSNNLAFRVRCLVMTKGLPHRVQDTDTPNNADFPTTGQGAFIPELEANDETAASVDSELTLLWQDLNNTEAGGSADSRADGCIQNPFWRTTRSMSVVNNANLQVQKTFSAVGIGPYWAIAGSAGAPTRLGLGDMCLVARLDGRSIGAVQSMIDRAQNVLINTNTTAILLDEDGTDLDNQGSVFSNANGGDDYEQTQSAIVNDRRFSFTFPAAPPNVFYNNSPGPDSFFVGPRLNWTAGILRPEPVILVASYGANHAPAVPQGLGVPQTVGGGNGAIVYATSYNYPPGAVFNTVESFNGRDFGGLGQLSFAQQMQAADFLESGGTFAMCNVWEPLADTIPDNLQLANLFILGNLSWAEASWASVPTLSWMQMSVGEPLARCARSNEDIDANQRISVDDVYTWEALPAASPTKDINRNATADSADRALLLGSLRASERVVLFAAR